MITNQEAIILAERATDRGSIGAVLREWGYWESEIQRFLKEPMPDQKLYARRDSTDDQSGKMSH